MSDPQKKDESWLTWLERQAKKDNLYLDPQETLEGIASTKEAIQLLSEAYAKEKAKNTNLGSTLAKAIAGIKQRI